MAAILGDLLQATVRATYLSQTILNIFHYRITNVTGLSDAGYIDFATWIATDILGPVRLIQSSLLTYQEIEIRNLSNNIDVASVALTATGSVTATEATSLPSYVSLGFKLVRESLVTRNGYKRFAGLVDAQVTGNTFVPSSGTIIPDIEEALAADWVFGVVNTAEPVIVKRPIVPPVGTTYEYASIGSAVVADFVGTQNTRKPGHGI